MNKISLFAASALLGLVAQTSVADAPKTYPAVIQNLTEQGIVIRDQFISAGGIVTYAATAQGRPLALYLSPDKKHVIVGTLVDEQGNNLTEDELQKRVVEPMTQEAWAALEKADWILDGKKDAPVIIYAFMDPRCGYCHKFRDEADAWVKAGKVQIRHVLVGILGPASEAKAATILGSPNPTAAFLNNQHNYEAGGINPNKDLADRGVAKMEKNNQLMQDLGLTGTPAIYYQYKGKVEVSRGMPNGAGMAMVMGGAKP